MFFWPFSLFFEARRKKEEAQRRRHELDNTGRLKDCEDLRRRLTSQTSSPTFKGVQNSLPIRTANRDYSEDEMRESLRRKRQREEEESRSFPAPSIPSFDFGSNSCSSPASDSCSSSSSSDSSSGSDWSGGGGDFSGGGASGDW